MNIFAQNKKFVSSIFAVLLLIALTFCFMLPTNRSEQMLASADDSTFVSSNVELVDYLEDLAGTPLLTADVFNGITSLTLDGIQDTFCDALITIEDLQFFEFSALTTLIFRNMANLEVLDMSISGSAHTSFPNLINITVQDCAGLTALDISGHNALENLQVFNCGALEELNLPRFENSIRSLRCENIDALEVGLVLDGAYPSLESIILKNSAKIERIDMSGLVELVSVEISNLSGLINCSLYDTRAITTFKLRQVDALATLILPLANSIEILEFDENVATTTNKILSSTSLKTIVIIGCGLATYFDISNATNIESVNFSGCANAQTVRLASSLERLVNLNLSGLVNLSHIDFSQATNMQKLNLRNCGKLDQACYNPLNSFEYLQFLDVFKTNIRTIELSQKPSLEFLTLGSNSLLTRIDLSNVAVLNELSIADCAMLLSLTIKNAPSLETLAMHNLKNLNALTITGTAVQQLNIVSFEQTRTMDFRNNAKVEILSVVNCVNLEELFFSGCTKLSEITIVGNENLNSNISTEINSNKSLTRLEINACDKLNALVLESLSKLTYFDISEFTSLSTLKLNGLGNILDLNIYLPQLFENMFELVFINLPSSKFVSDSIVVRNTGLSIVEIKNVRTGHIDLSSNNITSIALQNITGLQTLNLANNRISTLAPIMTALGMCLELDYVFLNNNRFDLSAETNLNAYNNSPVKDKVVLGIQNAIASNIYNFSPRVFIDSFAGFPSDIKVVVLKSALILRNPDILNAERNGFSTFNVEPNKVQTFATGTYIIKYYRIAPDGTESYISPGDHEAYLYKSTFFNVNLPTNTMLWLMLTVIGAALVLLVYGTFLFIRIKNRNKNLYFEHEDAEELKHRTGKKSIFDEVSESAVISESKAIKKAKKNKMPSEINEDFYQKALNSVSATEEYLAKGDANNDRDAAMDAVEPKIEPAKSASSIEGKMPKMPKLPNMKK